jgi:multidrug efflux pump subunit AcrA (membrane-fusion protein)
MFRSAWPKLRGPLVAVVLICAGVVAYVWWPHRAPKSQSAKSPPVPVAVVEAQRRSFPVYLDSLGTVQPLNTVQCAVASMAPSFV